MQSYIHLSPSSKKRNEQEPVCQAEVWQTTAAKANAEHAIRDDS